MTLVGLLTIILISYPLWLALFVPICFLFYRHVEYRSGFIYKFGYLVTCAAACILSYFLLMYGSAFIQVIGGIEISGETLSALVEYMYLIVFFLYVYIGYITRKLFLQKKVDAS